MSDTFSVITEAGSIAIEGLWLNDKQPTDDRNGTEHIALDVRCAQAKEANREECFDLALPRRIVLTLHLVNAAIDLDDKPSARREEIDDVAIERMLPTKANPELPSAKLRPKKCFAASGLLAHLASAMKEKRWRGAVVVVHALAKRKIHDSAPAHSTCWRWQESFAFFACTTTTAPNGVGDGDGDGIGDGDGDGVGVGDGDGVGVGDGDGAFRALTK